MMGKDEEHPRNPGSERYEFSRKTTSEMEWLKQYLGLERADQVISAAVTDFRERKRKELPAKLTRRDDGWYDLSIGGEIVATCNERTVKGLPVAKRRQLLESQIPDGRLIFAELMLVGARLRERAMLYPEVIEALFGHGD